MKLDRDTTYTEEELLQAFPEVDPGFEPFGSRVLVQVRSPKVLTKGGIILSDEGKEIEKWNTQIAKVIALGPVAFRSRDCLETWPEGDWVKKGDFVRIPKFNQDRYEIEVHCGEKSATGTPVKTSVLFMIINDLDLIAKKTGNPLEVKAYV